MLHNARLLAAAAMVALAGPLPASAADKPSDPEIAHIAYTAGSIDADVARLALVKSNNATVREFAQTMLRDHEAVNGKALDLVKKLGVTPQSNSTSEALARQAAATKQRLSGLDGAAFDRAYAENEVAFHRTVNGALKDLLIPSAGNGELKSLLETGLTLFSEHQLHAEHLARSLD